MKKRLKKETYKFLLLKLKRYKEMKEDISSIELETFYPYQGRDDNSYIRSINSNGDKTGRIATTLVENKEYNNMVAWTNCIDDLLNHYSKEHVKYEFIRRRYITRRLENFEIPYNVALKDNHVIMDLDLEGYSYSPRTWKYWKSEMVYQLFLIARGKNLIKSDKN